MNKSSVILTKLFGMPIFKKATTILFYASFDGEVDTFAMMRQAQLLGKKIALPHVQQDKKRIIPRKVKDLTRDLEDGPYGIKQPKETISDILPLHDIEAVIVPGVAFDRKNHRLGRGAGYYDRFLSTLPNDIPTIGLAFDFQIVDTLPGREAHDVRLSCVVTN